MRGRSFESSKVQPRVWANLSGMDLAVVQPGQRVQLGKSQRERSHEFWVQKRVEINSIVSFGPKLPAVLRAEFDHVAIVRAMFRVRDPCAAN